MAEKPVMHGRDHRPGGLDPTLTGIWHEVGGSDIFATVGDLAPPAGGTTVAFVTGSNMAPTGGIPNPVPMRFRLAIGPLNILSYDRSTKPPTVTGIDTYTEHQVEIQGDVTGVSPGDTVFVLPIEYQISHDVPLHTHDDSGTYVACRLLSTGEFIYGTP